MHDSPSDPGSKTGEAASFPGRATAHPQPTGAGSAGEPAAGPPPDRTEPMEADSMRRALELQRLNDELREKASLLDKAQDAILVRDMQHRITYWNKSAERLYGWTAEQALGKSAETLLKTDAKTFQHAFEEVFREGEWTGELNKIAKDGSTLTVEAHWTLVRDSQGRPASILDINTDISARKKAEQQMLRAQRMESIGTLAGGVAHDLNNVLAPILMALDLLRMHCPNPEAEDLLHTLRLTAQRGADLVKQLLSFSRGLEGERIAVNLTQVLHDLSQVTRETFPKNIEITMPPGDGTWTVVGDATQLHQVFLNLFVNARDAMPGGGKLTVALKHVVLDEHYARANGQARSGAYIRVTVTDTGMGMTPSTLDRIFEPFYTTKQIGQGTGLGLSTSLAIVKSHGGFITAYSELGKGTTFTVHLPASTVSGTASGGGHSRPILPQGQGELILVVDDEASIRMVAQLTLEHYGYRVLTASEGAEALALYAAQQDRIGLVLTDMAMPVMDGPTMISALRAINPRLRIIGSSGLPPHDPAPEAAGEKVNHFLIKPYTAEALLMAIATVLRNG